ncbi:MAG TPA: DUF192 domain-containing protein [Candidatus Dormibacteraeota bacterium]|nr:DUF192 domain-containing protein [Candidatus Dormibacteraeota bacterium]
MRSKEAASLRLLRTGEVVADRVRVPRTFIGRGIGLLGRAGLEPGEGMWIKPCNGIHMWFMRFTLDAVFLDRRLRVVRVVPELRPWRMVPLVLRAQSVVELPAGTSARLGLVEGDELERVRTGG